MAAHAHGQFCKPRRRAARVSTVVEVPTAMEVPVAGEVPVAEEVVVEVAIEEVLS